MKNFGLCLIVVIFFSSYNHCIGSDCAGVNDGTVTIISINPEPGTTLQYGSTVVFSGTISYSFTNANSGSVFIGLSPLPIDDDNSTIQVPIESKIELNQSNGTINFSNTVVIERSTSDNISQLDSFKVRAILDPENFTCSSIIDDTDIYPIEGISYDWTGDVNHSKTIDLTDAILSLQVVTGIDKNVYRSGDVNNDDRIGIEEALFVLQKVADLR